jgi:NADH-quinone oxidoreductase subunit G
VDAESMLLMKRILQHIGSQHMDCRTDGAYADPDNECSYIFNTSLADIERADVCLLIGTNPSWEAPVLNLRLRRGVVRHGMQVFRIGFQHDLTYRVTDLGNDLACLNSVVQGAGELASILNQAKRPALILGQAALKSPQAAILLNTCAKVADRYNFVQDDGWNGFNVLHTAAGRVGGLDVGFVPGSNGFGLSDIISATHDGRIQLLFLLGADEVAHKISSNTFVVYIGHHGDKGAQRADVILPRAAYTEKDAIYTNTEGRSQYACKAVDPPGQAKADWQIFAALLKQLNYKRDYATLAEVRRDLQHENIEFAENRSFKKRHWNPSMGTDGVLTTEALTTIVENFYMTNIISRYSKVMAECTEIIGKGVKHHVG